MQEAVRVDIESRMREEVGSMFLHVKLGFMRLFDAMDANQE